MANIFWNSSSINSFFRTSLKQTNTPMSGIYNSLNDAALIKNGGYSKLMKSYYAELKKQQAEESSKNKTEDKSNVTKENTTYNPKGTKNQSISSILDEFI